MTPTHEKARPVVRATAEPVLTNPSRGKAMNKSVNTMVADSQATPMSRNIDAIDAINEAKQLIEVIFMAAAALDHDECAAMQTIAEHAKAMTVKAVAILEGRAV
ncbi:hypothetical protein [Phyllobacterium sp. K27]